jgi:hypothetical protein
MMMKMITLELDIMGNGYRPFMVPKDSARSVEKRVDWKFLFRFEEIALLHPDGLRGVYAIRFSPEGEDEFTVEPEPDTLYTPDEARNRMRKMVSSFGPALYLAHRLFSNQPAPDRIGF